MPTKQVETAEQKLLKMIETSSGTQSPAIKAEQKVIKKQSFLAVLKTVNNILVAGVVMTGIFFANEIRVGMSLLNRDVHFSTDQKVSKQTLTMDTLVPNIQNISFYLANIKQRNIFQPFDTEKIKTVDSSASNRRIVQQTRSLRLVGISWLNSVDSASAMIEDVEKKETYFVQKGEKIGDVVVKTIYADSAVLGYENEEMIIKYDKPQM